MEEGSGSNGPAVDDLLGADGTRHRDVKRFPAEGQSKYAAALGLRVRGNPSRTVATGRRHGARGMRLAICHRRMHVSPT